MQGFSLRFKKMSVMFVIVSTDIRVVTEWMRELSTQKLKRDHSVVMFVAQDWRPKEASLFMFKVTPRYVNLCQTEFLTEYYLKTHIETTQTVRTHICDECQNKLPHKNCLKKHVDVWHRGLHTCDKYGQCFKPKHIPITHKAEHGQYF